MMLFNRSDHAELGCQFLEAFRFRRFGKSFVHICPFVVLAGSRCSQVLRGAANPFQFLEPHLGMLFFIIRRLQEQCGNLFKAFLLCFRRKIRVFVPRLGFPCKSGL